MPTSGLSAPNGPPAEVRTQPAVEHADALSSEAGAGTPAQG
jgi:hypothetical protein